ncbi:MAG TPA: NADPH-dependent glutamate synthase [Candidatus Hydrogenedentes bacterium]|nr:NADPH-dependent glutamate synthase [Candidatus Hydrogenedentota bacterium]HPG68322.1 NADPH-dependent glutamate synthase [Candidatus Hydrogenedentota bacterium]
MFRILSKRELAEKIKEYVVEAPMIALKAKPGNFVLVRTDERAERIPLTIADSDAQAGTVTMVVQEIGRGTLKLGELSEGDTILDIVGPLGKDREMPSGNETVVCVSGGLGVAPMYPQTKACHENGCKVISIIGSRSKSLFFWQDRIEAISDEVMYSTDDGSFGHHGFATQLLEQVIARGEPISEVIAIGPVPHMRAVVNTCKKHNVPCVVSLNPIMVDGTGMCGGCRVTVAGETKYACVDGPEFDGLEVDFAELMARQGAYRSEEQRPVEPEEECRLEKQVAEMEAAKAGDGAHHRPTTFNEVARVYTEEEALAAAGRCLVCKKPQCITGCPVEVDIPGFIKAVQDKDFRGAAAILKDKNNLPAICGRVCPQENQCEKTCVLGRKSTPVTIGKLERFVADWEAAHEPAAPVVAESNGKRVAVIGSGPGGLTCAGDLAKLGYAVTIFEAFHDTGGVLRYGIPEFRLPKAIVDREVAYVKSLGVQIKLNMVMGKVATVQDIFDQGFSAVFIAVGAGAPAFMNIPGENFIGVFSANELLTRVNLMKAYRKDYDTPVLVGERVAVVGAGNVAMDAARVSLRLGAKEVTIVYRRSETEIPARAEEVQHAREEGVQFKLLTNPVRILADEKNHVIGMECIKMELGEPDASGRRRPIPIKGSEFTYDCDMVVPALGNKANPLLTGNTKGLELNKWGNIVVNPETFATNLPGVYAGGDIVTGSATVIEAMGAGKIAARSIHQYLSGSAKAAVAAE